MGAEGPRHTNCSREARREFNYWASEYGTYTLVAGLGPRGGRRDWQRTEVALTVSSLDEESVSWSAVDQYGNSYELTWYKRRADWPRGWRNLAYPDLVVAEARGGM
jgi:hypothetical protein